MATFIPCNLVLKSFNRLNLRSSSLGFFIQSVIQGGQPFRKGIWRCKTNFRPFSSSCDSKSATTVGLDESRGQCCGQILHCREIAMHKRAEMNISAQLSCLAPAIEQRVYYWCIVALHCKIIWLFCAFLAAWNKAKMTPQVSKVVDLLPINLSLSSKVDWMNF